MQEILLVEDSKTQVVLLKRILEPAGFKVDVVHGGSQALRWFETHTPCPVLTDVTMPEINGYELCSRLKKIPGFLNVPVILLASLRGPEDLTQILKSGADGFIYKEFDPNYFIPMLSSILMSHSSDSRDNRSFELKFSESNISLSSLALKNILMCSFGTAVYCREKLESSKIKT